MSASQVPLTFFRRDELQPSSAPGRGTHPEVELLTPAEHHNLADLAKGLSEHSEVLIPTPDWNGQPHVRAFVALLHALGAVTVTNQAGCTCIKPRGRLATHLAEILAIYVKHGFCLFDGWHRTAILPEGGVSATGLIHHAELRRIEQSKRAGIFPAALQVRPSAFVIFRALNKSGESCYLFEVNKDWQRLNLIGGKQEASDGGDFTRTAKREVHEELGIAASRLSLARLNDDPILGYFLSGIGVLTSYPCVLFGGTVTGTLPTRPVKDRWLTERQIRAAIALDPSPIMVNPQYLSFLLEGTPSRLARCPLSTPTRVEAHPDPTLDLPSGSPRRDRITGWIKRNKELIAAVLTIIAALLTVLVACLT